MTNIRVQRFSNPDDLRVCESEGELGGEGWAVLIPDTTGQEMVSDTTPPKELETLPEGGWRLEVIEALCHDPFEVFRDREFVGDALIIEVVRENQQFAELVYRPLPPPPDG